MSHESKPDCHPELPLSEPVNNQQWEKICWRTNKEVDKHSSAPLTKMKHFKKERGRLRDVFAFFSFTTSFRLRLPGMGVGLRV